MLRGDFRPPHRNCPGNGAAAQGIERIQANRGGDLPPNPKAICRYAWISRDYFWFDRYPTATVSALWDL